MTNALPVSDACAWLHGVGVDLGSVCAVLEGTESSFISMHAAVLPWGGDSGDEPECAFWNGTFQWDLGPCSHFSMSRLSRATMAEATSRAVACAARHSTDCILGPEVGIGLPAVFAYDAAAGMRLVLAPRPIVTGDEEWATVRVADPSGRDHSGKVVRMRQQMEVEFLPLHGKRLETETFSGNDAFCVQLARRAISAECWTAIDY